MFLYLKFLILQRSFIKTKNIKDQICCTHLHSIVSGVKKMKYKVSSRFVIKLSGMSSFASLSAELTSDEMGNPDNVKHFGTVSIRVSFHDSLIQCTVSNSFISFQINFVLKR
jgi:hypothetical protein